jgi:2-keto-4-pentenoate hydratase/2-oxohepta-3-ene-1,7-dioic acid hydratase in catechol pathway
MPSTWNHIMKLLRFGPKGHEKPGLLDKDGNIRDLSGVIDDIAAEVLSAEGLAKLASIDPASLPIVAPDVRYGPCVGRVGKFICVGLNYADHAAESGLQVPEEPVIFMKATSAIIGPNDDVLMPRGSTKLDWEVELGVVIGAHASYVTEAEALDYVAGYCTINDVSERAFQLERSGTWDKGKGCDTFGPIGPWLVTKDEAGDVTDLKMWLDVNGKRYQNGSTKTMVFKPAFLIHYISQFMSLQPGDIISTGTPPGVGLGQKPEPVYLQVGDLMALEIQGLGSQRQAVGRA